MKTWSTSDHVSFCLFSKIHSLNSNFSQYRCHFLFVLFWEDMNRSVSKWEFQITKWMASIHFMSSRVNEDSKITCLQIKGSGTFQGTCHPAPWGPAIIISDCFVLAFYLQCVRLISISGRSPEGLEGCLGAVSKRRGTNLLSATAEMAFSGEDSPLSPP